MAPSLGVEVNPINMRDPNELERAVAAFANNPNSGLIATRSGLALRHRELIVMLAARHKGDRMKPQTPRRPGDDARQYASCSVGGVWKV